MFTELIEKAKTCTTADELLAFAKANNVELTTEQATKLLNKLGEGIADEELEKVVGGSYLPYHTNPL